MKKGFTLIELLAVIILLGTIILIVYPNVNNIILDSKTKSLTKTIESLKHAAYMYTVENDVEASSLEKPIYPTELITNGYLKEVPTNPITKEKLTGCILYKWDNNQYQFRYDEECEADKTTSSDCFDFDKITGTITGYNYNGLECDADVVIPDIIDDIVVQHIGYAAFIDEITYQRCADDDGNWHEVDSSFVHYEGDGYEFCYIEADNSNPITSVVLPENIISIKDWSFSYNKLTNLTLNNLSNLVTIDFFAFYHNQLMGLTLTNLPQLTTIGYGAFAENQINNLDLNDLPQLTTIEYCAFMGNQITDLTLNNLPQLTTIGDGAFAENQINNLDLNDLPQLTTIEYGAFMGNQITDLTLNSLPQLTTIGMAAFGYNQLTELIMNDLPMLATIDSMAFAVNQLEEITLNNLPSLTSIGVAAFLKGYEPSISNLNLAKIINKTTSAYDWTSITGSYTDGQIFETGTIIHPNGNIEVVLE